MMANSESAQKRAQEAFAAAKNITCDRKKYAAYVKKFPAYITTNGLAATLAFALQKGGEYAEIAKQLHERLKHCHICTEQNYNGFMEWLLDQNSDVYRRATAEVLAYLEWLRRFAREE
ncbi:MAG: type III-B CRISPR module-associated protein Cmr5 [Oscillospiraceae bacterium]|jgi:CRISPR-associated protein Cmr5|nr:type III-B CRISPR module-associated protein Cmr5 [Oscillospiraceae bacterium]